MLSKGFKYIGFHTVNGRNQPVIENKNNSANSDNWEWQVGTFSFVHSTIEFMRRGKRVVTEGIFRCKQTGELVRLKVKP